MAATEIEARKATPILLLKTKSTPHDGYEEQFAAVGGVLDFEPIFVPVLEHKFFEDDLNRVRDLLRNKQIGTGSGRKYGGMIFTSQRAVEAFARIVGEGKGDEQWPYLQRVPIYTVGPATSRALRTVPQVPHLSIFGAETGNGEALAHYMLDHYRKHYPDETTNPPLLFLVGDQRRDIIPKTLMDRALSNERRIQVDELVVYGTGVMESFEQDFTKLLRETKDCEMRWVVVFSPTGCEAMLRALGLLDHGTGKSYSDEGFRRRGTYIATIGPTTRDFLRTQFSFEPDVCAERPSPEGVEHGIRNFLKNKS